MSRPMATATYEIHRLDDRLLRYRWAVLRDTPSRTPRYDDGQPYLSYCHRDGHTYFRFSARLKARWHLRHYGPDYEQRDLPFRIERGVA